MRFEEAIPSKLAKTHRVRTSNSETMKFILSMVLGAQLFALAAAAQQPNVILFLADDLGWTHTSVGPWPSDFHETPNLESLASAGVVFTNAHAPAPTCAPSRASIMTGISPAALHVTVNPDYETYVSTGVDLLDPDLVTIAEAIKAHDPTYATANFGKWHLGSGGPGMHGFDVHDGDPDPALSTGDPDNPKDIFGITARAVAFMRAQVAAGRPFYMQLSHFAPHLLDESRPATLAKYQAKPPGVEHVRPEFAAMVEDLDAGLGLVLDELGALGIAGSTYVIFVSDNGGLSWQASNAPLRGEKGLLWEGGTRVPMVVSGPGISAGEEDELFVGQDLMPTILGWVGAPVPADVEGVAWGSASPSRQVVWHFPHLVAGTILSPGIRPHSAIREGPWKLIFFNHSGITNLFDLELDVGEEQSLHASYPSLSDQLRQDMDAYLASVEAEEPPPRPHTGRACGLGGELVLALPLLLLARAASGRGHLRGRRRSTTSG